SDFLHNYPRDYISYLFFFTHPPPTYIYTLSLHDALPISLSLRRRRSEGDRVLHLGVRRQRAHAHPGTRWPDRPRRAAGRRRRTRSEEHTSELQSRGHLVCRLLLEKKKKNRN